MSGRRIVSNIDKHEPNLGSLSIQLQRLFDESQRAADMDSGFDHGEFSGPWHERNLDIQLLDAIHRAGFRSCTEVIRCVERRLAGRASYVFIISMLPLRAEEGN